MSQIVALGGGGFSMEPTVPHLDDYVLSLASHRRPRVCFVPTASGDAADYTMRFYAAFATRSEPTHLALFNRSVADLRSLVLAQDILYVGGGNTANLVAVWRAHGLDAIVREAWERGVILAGVSAGALCWFEDGVTDSFGPSLSALHGGLGLLAGSHCPHYADDNDRRAAYQRCVGEGMKPGVAAEDSVALHFVDGTLAHVVSSRPNKQAYRVERVDGKVVETAIPARCLA